MSRKNGSKSDRRMGALTAVASSAGVRVNGAHVQQRDIVATNVAIHVIDAVIMPRNWQLLAAAA